jgi:hypothetical protein
LKRAAKAAKQDEKDGVHKIDEDRDNTWEAEQLGKVTDTKVKELFQSPSPDFSDQTCLAQNMISFCCLNKTRCQPRVLQRFLKTHLVNQFTGRNFQENLVPQTGILKNSLVYLFPDRSFLGMFPFPAWSYLRIPGISNQEKLPVRGSDPPFFWLLSRCLTSSPPALMDANTFVYLSSKNNILICHSKNFVV